MRKGQTKGEDGLQHLVWTRVNQSKYNEIERLIAGTKNETISSIVRKIIYKNPIKVYIHDESMDLLLEELAVIRGEIKAIGVNINQLAKLFNTYPEEQKKAFYAKIGYQEYLRLESKIDRTLLIISKLGKKWLSE
ncbi:plasmid mobilization protein [Chitinophaga niabensis]|uniref:Mobilisation protein (MobC) n=1 Tax=Chitinophaga niabensis TaxID=536979 RepID=A0A1N6KAG7_9BACT|nr:plasmid mobilization relaxosome protein MobC [Chitinophaga niabensis]SIO53531.1 mobilisation protein (MobC) [Chitinophaga niabensis]